MKVQKQISETVSDRIKARPRKRITIQQKHAERATRIRAHIFWKPFAQIIGTRDILREVMYPTDND